MSVDTAVPDLETDESTGKGSKKRLLVIVVLVLALAAGAWWWFMVRPSGAEPPPEPGEVLVLEAIQVNLTDGHYLRVGLALQGTVEAGEELDGSKALDATIELFTGQAVEDLAKEHHRTKLKEKLLHELEELYEHEVIEVYFTDFVTQ